MSEAELANLFHAHTETFTVMLFGYFSVTSAFLAAIYLVGKTLPPLLAYVILALYAVTALTLTGLAERHINLVIDIRNELASVGANWHSAVSEPQFILPTATYAGIFSMFAIFCVSIVYFFHTRKS